MLASVSRVKLASVVLSVVFVLASVHPVSAALDTKAAAKCVALAALDSKYLPKARAVWETARRTGYLALLEHRSVQEAQEFIAIKGDKRQVEIWLFDAFRRCNSI